MFFVQTVFECPEPACKYMCDDSPHLVLTLRFDRFDQTQAAELAMNGYQVNLAHVHVVASLSGHLQCSMCANARVQRKQDTRRNDLIDILNIIPCQIGSTNSVGLNRAALKKVAAFLCRHALCSYAELCPIGRSSSRSSISCKKWSCL